MTLQAANDPQLQELAGAWRNFVDLLDIEGVFDHLSTEDAIDALLGRSLLEQLLGSEPHVVSDLLADVRESDLRFRRDAAKLLENTKVALYSDRADDPAHWWWRLEELVLGQRGEALVSVAEAAEIKGVHPHTVRKAIRLGILPARRLARGFLMRRIDLERWEPSAVGRPRRQAPSDRLLEAFNEANTSGDWDRAHSIAAALGQDATTPRRRLAVAIDHFNSGALEAAILWSQAVISDAAAGKSAEVARIVAGRAHLALGQASLAASVLGEAEAPDDLRWLRDIALAEALLALDQPRKALRIASCAPDGHPEVEFVRARMQWHCDYVWSALESITRYRVSRPDDVDGLLFHGAVLGHIGDVAADRRAYVAAHRLFLLAVRGAPSPDGYRLVGLTAARLGWWSRLRRAVGSLAEFGDTGAEAGKAIADAWVASQASSQRPTSVEQLDYLEATVGASPGILRERALQLVDSDAPMAHIDEFIDQAALPDDQAIEIKSIALARRGQPGAGLRLVRTLSATAPGPVLLLIARYAVQCGAIDEAREALRDLQRDGGPFAPAASVALELAAAMRQSGIVRVSPNLILSERVISTDEPLSSQWEGPFHPQTSRVVMRVSALPQLVH